MYGQVSRRELIPLPRAPDLSGLALDGRYELHAIIGEGAFGRVYRGRDRRLARVVAVKVIKPWWAEDPDWVRNFEREAQLLASISDPGIVQIYDVGSSSQGIYYVAELVDGESLVSRLANGPLGAREAVDIAEQLARALATAHLQRVVHRDIKPANVLISNDGRVKVADFGVARLAEGTTDGGTGTVVGTPRYMAPEQAEGGQITPATDVYGVGVVLYEMLAGHPPFRGGSAVELAMRHVNDAPPPLGAETPAALEHVVTRALAKHPEDRYPDGSALAAALAEAGLAFEDDVDEDARMPSHSGSVALLTPPDTTTTTQAAATRRIRAPVAPAPAEDPQPGATRVGDPYTPRQNVNPPARRRRIALVGLVLLLGAGMIVGAMALAPGHVRVPGLHGLTRGRAYAKAHHTGLQVSFTHRYSGARRGTVVDQHPRARSVVGDGTTVRVTLSAGPAPVTVPKLLGSSEGEATTLLNNVKLRASTTDVPAPGVSPGTVTHQSPSPGARIPPDSGVSISVAEAPQWRPLTSIEGTSSAHSVPFKIRGSRWQLVYGMAFQGTCTFLFFCSGPSATVTNLTTGATVDHFGLGEGNGRTHVEPSGPGLYQVSVSPGSDTARWTIKVDDYY
jgi:serine/threonine-protein kinase